MHSMKILFWITAIMRHKNSNKSFSYSILLPYPGMRQTLVRTISITEEAAESNLIYFSLL